MDGKSQYQKQRKRTRETQNMMKIYKWDERYTIEGREGWMKILCEWEMKLAQGSSNQKNETLLCTVCVKKL